jgi:hypothetical protein
MLDGGRWPGFVGEVNSTGQAPILRWIDGRLWLIIRIPHTCVWWSMVVSRWIYRMVWVKCTTSTECKSIRIVESSVMDGWDDHYLAQCQVLVLQKCFWKNGERCQTECSEGTAVARWWFGVLAGYCRRNGGGHVWLTKFIKEGGHVWLTIGFSLENELPLS